MGKNFCLVKCELDEEWDLFINSSPDLSVYITRGFLESITTPLGLYKCFKGQELRAVLIVGEDKSGKNALKPEFLIYSGICFGKPTNNQNTAQQISERYELTEFIFTKLTELYNSITLLLPPSINDIRPFQWHNYGKEKDRCVVDVRLTAYLNIEDINNSNNIEKTKFFLNLSSSRKQQIRYSIREKIETKLSYDVDLFIKYYEATMKKSGIVLDRSAITRFHNHLNIILSNGVAKMYLASSKDGNPGSFGIFGIDNLRAHYLYGASNPELRSNSTGTAVIWHAFKDLNKHNVKEINLEGVNSPQRGKFKLSFGGQLIPYFYIKYPNQNFIKQ